MSHAIDFRSSRGELLRILYVGRGSSGLRFRKLVLEQRGYLVTTASSTSQALRLFAATRFDIVITDLANEAAASLVADIKDLDSSIPVIGLSDEPQLRVGPHGIDACVKTADGPFPLLAKVDALARGRLAECAKTFPDASEALRSLLLMIVASPSESQIKAMARSAQAAETEIREFERETTCSGNQPRSAVLTRVVERIRIALCADGAAIAFCDSQGLICEASAGDAPAVGSRVQPDSRLTKEYMESGRILLCEDSEHDPRVTPSLVKSLKFRSAAVVPIHGRSSILGVVEAFSSQTFAFDANDVVRLARIARLLVPFADALQQHEQRREFAPVIARGSPGRHFGNGIGWRPWIAAAVAVPLVLMAILFASLKLHQIARNSSFIVKEPPGVSISAPKAPDSAEREAPQSRILEHLSRDRGTAAARFPYSNSSSSHGRFSSQNIPEGRTPAELSKTPASQAEASAVTPPTVARPVAASPVNGEAVAPVPPSVVAENSPALAQPSEDTESAVPGSDLEKKGNTEIAAAIRPEPKPVEIAAPDFVLDHTLKGHSSWVTGVAFSADGQRLASGSWDRSVKFWDVSTGRELGTAFGDAERIQALTFSPDGHWLAAENSNNTVTLWNASTGREVRTLPGDKPLSPFGSNWVYSIAFSPDGCLLASAVDDRTIRLWDVKTGRTVRDLPGSKRSVIYIAFSPDGRLLASGKDDNTINIWDVESGRVVHTLGGHNKSVYAVAFSPDGRSLASAGADRAVRLWDIVTGTEIHDLKGHHDRVTTLAFSPDGRWLASGSWDKTVKIWDVSSGRELETLSGNSHDVYTVAFNSRGQWLASGSEDGTVKLWRLKNTVTGADFDKEGRNGSQQ